MSPRARHHRPFGGHRDTEAEGFDLLKLQRREFGKDYDHVLYSSAFRRLGGVTQVVGVDETALFHNRMTHSLKVTQVGRRLTNRLLDKIEADSLWPVVEEYGGALDPRVVHAACIAHDLGRPPFGHVAERALQKLLTGTPDTADDPSRASLFPRVLEGSELIDSFESSAQAFRIVNKLAFRESYDGDKSAALNLTRATLAALLRYPWSYADRSTYLSRDDDLSKWGFYNSERRIFDFVSGLIVDRDVTLHNGETKIERRTIEAQVVDWADDISYAVHDVEDFFRARLIPLDTLAWSDERFGEFFKYAWRRVEHLFVMPTAAEAEREAARRRVAQFLEEARSLLPSTPYKGTRQDREDLHGFASTIIRSATDNTTLTKQGLVLPAERDLAIIEVFKQLIWYYVIDSPSFASAQRGQVYVIRQLFRDLAAWVRSEFPATDNSGGNLPSRLREYVRIALDMDPDVGCTDYRTDESKIRRAVVDYICSLTERQAILLANQLHGAAPRPLLGSWFHM